MKEWDKVRPIFEDGELVGGTVHDREVALSKIQEDQIYTVDYIVNHRFKDDIYLKEFPGVNFNLVHFEDYE